MTTHLAKDLHRLFLIRHGDTAWSDSGQHTGRTDIPLTPSGEEQARHLGERLQGERFTRLWTSPRSRAVRTAELANFPVRAKVDADLSEWDYGDYEGRTSVDVHRGRPDWDLFRDGAPNGESPDQVAARADRFLSLVRATEGDVAAVAHAHIIRMIAARWLSLPPQAAAFFYTATASVGVLGYEHGRPHPVLLLWNDVGAINEVP